MLKCNVDASRLDRENIVELVAIIRDSHGLEIKCFSGFEKAFLYSPCSVEVFAIREVLSWLKSLRLDDVIIESDCQVLVIIEGGLGLRDLESWKKASILQHIWLILTQAGSLWIAWVEAYVLEGESLMQIPMKSNRSCHWRKLLKFHGVGCFGSHFVISWLAIQDRHPIKARFIQRRMNIDGRCKLCFEEQETRDHLFFGCRFSKVIWEGIL
ncbi:reverse transcriptase [Gossypium australe]|uniref:Reverse transcriptase n=1 Tax=Gossypium australe TaxID=47621 RepID=A0A5B6W3C3_9ROSI|nr:reverse transcriptase [Gossypium australe]